MLHPGEAGFIFFQDDNIGVPQELNFSRGSLLSHVLIVLPTAYVANEIVV